MARCRRHKDIVDMIFEHGGKLLCDAADSGNTKLAKQLLDNQLADVNLKTKKGFTPLHFAIKKGNEELVTSLLEYNANPTDPIGVTLIELAQSSGNPKLVDLFAEEESFIPYHGILHSSRNLKKRGREALNGFNENQRQQCLASDQLRSLGSQINTKSPKDATLVSIGCILTRNTPITEIFRSGNWENIEDILQKLFIEKEEAENELKAKRKNDIKREILRDIECSISILIKGNIDDSCDEFSYRERGGQYSDVFDEFIIPNAPKSQVDELISSLIEDKMNLKSSLGTESQEDDALDLLIAEAEESIKKSKSQTKL